MPNAGEFNDRSAARLSITSSCGNSSNSAAFRPCSSVRVPPLLRRYVIRLV